MTAMEHQKENINVQRTNLVWCNTMRDTHVKVMVGSDVMSRYPVFDCMQDIEEVLRIIDVQGEVSYKYASDNSQH